MNKKCGERCWRIERVAGKSANTGRYGARRVFTSIVVGVIIARRIWSEVQHVNIESGPNRETESTEELSGHFFLSGYRLDSQDLAWLKENGITESGIYFDNSRHRILIIDDSTETVPPGESPPGISIPSKVIDLAAEAMQIPSGSSEILSHLKLPPNEGVTVISTSTLRILTLISLLNRPKE